MTIDQVAQIVGYGFMWFYGLIAAALLAWRVATALFPRRST